MNLEQFLCSINKFVNIDKERMSYTKHFDKLRDGIYDRLKKNTVLKKLLNGKQLEGSYGDNLKVKQPDEFDCVIRLKLPEFKQIIITKDPHVRGQVRIDLSKVLSTIKNQQQHKDTYKVLCTFIATNKGHSYIVVEKLQSWLQSIFQKALNDLQNRIEIDGQTSTLRYTRQGPAHTITVTDGPLNYSVDFVPSIQIAGQKFEAIPKPIKGCKEATISFRASYYREEFELIKDMNTLKNSVRLMKKFRDSHPNMSNLKSYYIKTLFLWKISSNKRCNSYWKGQLSTVLVDMFTELEKCLIAKRLPFFWDHGLNLFEHLSSNQLTAMLIYVKMANKELQRASNETPLTNVKKLSAIFLTREEAEEYERAVTIPTSNCNLI